MIIKSLADYEKTEHALINVNKEIKCEYIIQKDILKILYLAILQK